MVIRTVRNRLVMLLMMVFADLLSQSRICRKGTSMRSAACLSIAVLLLGHTIASANELRNFFDRTTTATLGYYTDDCDGPDECTVASITCTSDGAISFFARGLSEAEAEEAKYGGYAPIWVDIDGTRMPLTLERKDVWGYNGLWDVELVPTKPDEGLLARLASAKTVVLNVGPAKREMSGGSFGDLTRSCKP